MLTATSLIVLTQIAAATIDINPGDDLWGTLKAVQAGDEVIMHAGTYKVPGFVDLTFNGTADQPIIVRGGDGEDVVIEGISSQNTLNVKGSYYTLSGFRIVGGSHGIRLGDSDHGTIEDVEIVNVDDVGISCNRPDNTYEAMAIRRTHIHDTGKSGGPGECMYLGCNDNACQMWDSVIEFNWCHDTLSGSQGDGIEVKTGSYNNVVRHNVIHDVKYPGITIYGTVDNKAPNLVEGNAVWNVVDNGIQTVGDAIVRNNLIFDVGANGIHAKPSQGEIVENLTIAHNTVLNSTGVCLRGNEWPGGGAIVLANNALYCAGGTAIKLPAGAGTAMIAGNAVVGGVEGAPMGTFDGVSLDAAFLNAAGKEVYPKGDSPLLDAGAADYADEDFNCLPRDPNSVDVGAYDHSDADNPGWTVAPGFKSCAEGEGTTTGGESTTGDETTGDGTDGTDGTSGDTSAGTTGDATTDGSSDGSSDSGTGASDSTSDGSSATSMGSESSATAGISAGETAGDDSDEEGGCACDLSRETSPSPILGLLLLPLLPRRRRSRGA